MKCFGYEFVLERGIGNIGVVGMILVELYMGK